MALQMHASLSKTIQALLFLLPPSPPPEWKNSGQEVQVQLPWQPQSSQMSFVLTSQWTLLISSTCTWAYRRWWWTILLQWIRHAGLCCQSRICFLATASESVASYPGCMGGDMGGENVSLLPFGLGMFLSSHVAQVWGYWKWTTGHHIHSKCYSTHN